MPDSDVQKVSDEKVSDKRVLDVTVELLVRHGFALLYRGRLKSALAEAGVEIPHGNARVKRV
jgi:hypothetical protein